MKTVLISDVQDHPKEFEIVQKGFELGLESYHLRKPHWDLDQILDFVRSFSKTDQAKIAVHAQDEIMTELHRINPRLRIHLKADQLEFYTALKKLYPEKHLSHSMHELVDLHRLANQGYQFDYVFISPVFPSLTKADYQANWSDEQLKQVLNKVALLREQDSELNFEVMALGGVECPLIEKCHQLGFQGVALLGTIWMSQQPELVLEQCIQESKRLHKEGSKPPRVLLIGGFDPSGAAGLIADVKACEYAGAQAQGVVSAQTIQTERQFIEMGTPNQDAFSQLNALLDESYFRVLKIGMVPSLEFLDEALQLVENHLQEDPTHQNFKPFIIWDPILKASFAKDNFNWSPEWILEILKQVNLITPNLMEAEFLQQHFGEFSQWDFEVMPQVLVKGGHLRNADIIDRLYSVHGVREFTVSASPAWDKRGTGCTYASLVAAQLAQNKPLVDACRWAQRQMHYYLSSNQSLIGSWPSGVK